MDINQTVAAWVRHARKHAKLSGEKLGAQLTLRLKTSSGHTKANISYWETNKHQPSLQQLIAISQITDVELPKEILSAFQPAPLPVEAVPHRRAADFELVSAKDTDIAVGNIEYWDARGSCGGGFLNYDQLPKGHLVKEETFFHRYSLRPENAFAIYADGDSMAEFIVDGDIVIFDKSKTNPVSGEIFAIEHPDGLRIKLLRREIDGSWKLISKNQDKSSYPDERIPKENLDLLHIKGQFVYRQGG